MTTEGCSERPIDDGVQSGSTTGDLAGVPVTRVRDEVGRMYRLARTDDEIDGVELFNALCEYLDQLSGTGRFDRLLTPQQREPLATEIDRVRHDADHAPERPVRLNQPVNAAVTVAGGRKLARRLARSGDWQAGIGVALMALYDYLDELHGGPGRFTVLLNSRERALVAAQAPG